MGRQMPEYCKHGVLVDAGDFCDPANVSTCPECCAEGPIAQRDAEASQLLQRVQELEKQNALINAEYKKTWDVLRTYNPQDIELEYIGFETVEVKTSTD